MFIRKCILLTIVISLILSSKTSSKSQNISMDTAATIECENMPPGVSAQIIKVSSGDMIGLPNDVMTTYNCTSISLYDESMRLFYNIEWKYNPDPFEFPMNLYPPDNGVTAIATNDTIWTYVIVLDLDHDVDYDDDGNYDAMEMDFDYELSVEALDTIFTIYGGTVHQSYPQPFGTWAWRVSFKWIADYKPEQNDSLRFYFRFDDNLQPPTCPPDWITSVEKYSHKFIDDYDPNVNANFTLSPQTGNEPLTVLFNNISTGLIDSYHWDFGNGQTFDGENPPTQVFETDLCEEDFTVQLNVNGFGGSDMHQEVVHVDHDVDVAFGFEREPPDVPLSPVVHFEGLSSEDIITWIWDFKDGRTSFEQSPTNHFPEGCDQAFDVTLQVLTAEGCIGEYTQTVWVASTQLVPAPRVLVVNAGPDWEHFEEYNSVIVAHLLQGGWDPLLLPPDPDVSLVKMLLGKPEIRGLFIIGHSGGVDVNGNVIVGDYVILRDDADIRGRRDVTAAELAETRDGQHLDFVTAIACFQDGSGWHEAFTSTPDQVTLGITSINGVVNISEELVAEGIFRHGTSTEPCSQLLDYYSIYPLPKAVLRQYAASQQACGSFLICNDNGCGSEIYPAYSCSLRTDNAINGVFALGDPDGLFNLNFFVPSSYQDSLTCSATSFPTVPDTLIVPSFSPIGRFLLFKDYLSDPLLASDSISVVMGYTQSDLQTIGNPSENILAVSWITADPIGFQLVDANTDTTANTILFTIPAWGLVGIYVMNPLNEVAELGCPNDSGFQSCQSAFVLELSDFSITNKSKMCMAFEYSLHEEGPATLVDNGNPESLAGSTPLLCPGEVYSLPSAALEFPDTLSDVQEFVSCHVSVVGYPTLLDSCITVYTFGPPTGVTTDPISYNLKLFQNYPNPFNPLTKIRYSVPERCRVKLEVFDVAGRRIAILVDREQSPGSYSTVWNGCDDDGNTTASGIYFYRLVAGEFVQTKKLVLLK